MSEWDKLRLKDVGSLQRGKSKHRPRYAFHLYNGPYPFIQTGEIRESRKTIKSYSQTYSEAGLQQSKLWPKGTLCITIAANIAELGILGFDACFPDSVLGFIADNKKANTDFIYYQLVHFQRELKYLGEGSVQDNINLGTFDDVWFPIPPLPEQQAIAEVLSSLDDKIELLHRNNKTLEEMAETLFRQWFVEGAKEDWEEFSLDKLAEYLNGLALQKFPSEKGKPSIPAIKIREMNQGITDSTDMVSADIPKKYLVNNGDILFSWSGSLDVIIWSQGTGALNQHLFKVIPTEFPSWLVYFATRSFLPEFRDIANDKATTMGHIQRHHLSDAKIKLPESKQIQQYDKLVDPLFRKLLQNREQIHKLKSVRDTLLPKLMSGQVRVQA